MKFYLGIIKNLMRIFQYLCIKTKNINSFSNKSKKICILQLRNLKNIKFRNSSFEKYKKSILYLIKNDYIVYYFSEKDLNFFRWFCIFKNLSN